MGLILLGVAAIVLSVGVSFYFFSLSFDVISVTKARTIVYGNTPAKVSMGDEEYTTDEEDGEFVKAIQSQQFYKDFDARIERMKMEMAEDNIHDAVVTEAEELHPLVHNLPHSDMNELVSKKRSQEEVSY